MYADAGRQPVYATLRTEGPRRGADSVTLYADFYDVRTGKLRREQVLEPLGRRLDFQEAVRTPDGFALGYRSGPELDYVHGALLLADDGRELGDFQRKRME